jgi:hypothetical protein
MRFTTSPIHLGSQHCGVSQKTVEMGEAINWEIQRFMRQDLKEQQIPVEVKKAVYERLRKPAREMMRVQERAVERG